MSWAWSYCSALPEVSINSLALNVPDNTCNVVDESFSLFNTPDLQEFCECCICVAININEVVSQFVEKRQAYDSGALIVLDCHEDDANVRCGGKLSGQG